MKSRRTPDRNHREGYVSLLAMSFAFGLAILGGALAVGLRAYLVSVANQQREILDEITLESAAHEVLGRLSAGEVHSIRPSHLVTVEMNGRQVTVDLSLPEGKLDPAMDADMVVSAALRDRGVIAGERMDPVPSSFESLEAMSHGWRLSGAKEDCLRQLVTLGRAPEELRAEAMPGDEGAFSRSVGSGDQVDVRTSLKNRSGSAVLWMRARFSGTPARPWQVHDLRRLTMRATDAACRTEN